MKLMKLDTSLPKDMSKSAINEMVAQLVEQFKGVDHVHLAYTKLRLMEQIIKKVKPHVEGEMMEWLHRNGEKVSVNGVQINYSSGSRKLDYSNDSEWVDLNAKIKAREEFLKGLTKEMVDTDTGEVVNPPLVKYNKESIKVEF